MLAFAAFCQLLGVSLALEARSLTLDTQNGAFLFNGVPMQYTSGEMHYFRVPSPYWQDRLRKMRQAGINVVSMPIEWSLHEPYPGQFDFAGEADVEYFIQLAWSVELFVIVRAGPYIDADRDLGGLPAWLLFENPTPEPWLRSQHPLYRRYSERWLQQLLPRLKPFLYENGGPILMVQIENNFGDPSGSCEKPYLHALHNFFVRTLGTNVLYLTADRDNEGSLLCSRLDGVLLASSYDMTKTDAESMEAFFVRLRMLQPHTPIVTSEVITGVICKWNECKQRPDYAAVNEFFNATLMRGGSFNFYMFVGGTNFGFSGGGLGDFNLGLTTAYDNDAPINPAGDPTEQYYNIKAIINSFYPLARTPPLELAPKMAYPQLRLEAFGSLLDGPVKRALALAPVRSATPRTFRELQQAAGLVLYETRLIANGSFLTWLEARGVADRGYVFLRHIFVGYLTRHAHQRVRLVQPEAGDLLQILVESAGRLSKGFRLAADVKGIRGAVLLAGVPLRDWTMYRYPLRDVDALQRLAATSAAGLVRERGPTLYRATFQTVLRTPAPSDSYLDMQLWSRGLVFVNAYNLGRYWPVAGPQLTVYVPGCWLKPSPLDNQVVILELERPPLDNEFVVRFVPSTIYSDEDWNGSLHGHRGTAPLFSRHPEFPTIILSICLNWIL